MDSASADYATKLATCRNFAPSIQTTNIFTLGLDHTLGKGLLMNALLILVPEDSLRSQR